MEFYYLQGSFSGSNFWCDQDRLAKHELSRHVVYFSVPWEFIEHRAHERFSCNCVLVESQVKIVDQIVPIIDCVADSSEHSWCLEPGFTVRVLFIGGSPEEWHKSAKLVELDPHVIRRIAPEARNITTRPRHSRDSVHQILDRTSVYLFGGGPIGASPHGPVLLRA